MLVFVPLLISPVPVVMMVAAPVVMMMMIAVAIPVAIVVMVGDEPEKARGAREPDAG